MQYIANIGTMLSVCYTTKKILPRAKGMLNPHLTKVNIISSYTSFLLSEGASFAERAKSATFGLPDKETVAGQQERFKSQLKWGRKKKKFVKGDGAGADNMKIVKNEGGTRLPVTYYGGRFDECKANTCGTLARPRLRVPLGTGQVQRSEEVQAPEGHSGEAVG